MTLARFRIDVETNGLAPNTTLILDEVSQVATADAAWLLDTVVAVPGAAVVPGRCPPGPGRAGRRLGRRSRADDGRGHDPDGDADDQPPPTRGARARRADPLPRR